MPGLSSEATKWGTIGAVACFAIFAILVLILFSTGKVCTADYGNDGTSISACTAEESIASRIGRITEDDEIQQLASAVSSDESRAIAVAKQIHSQFPARYREVANIRTEAGEADFFSLEDDRLIDELSARFDGFSDIEGDDRFTEIERRIALVPLWKSLREDAKGRRTLFRPVADEFEATQPGNSPEACSVRSKASGPYADGDFIFLESADGTAAIVREVITDPLDGASYQFQLNPADSLKLRLTRGTQTRGTVYGRPATRSEIENLYNPCRDANPAESPA